MMMRRNLRHDEAPLADLRGGEGAAGLLLEERQDLALPPLLLGQDEHVLQDHDQRQQQHDRSCRLES